MNTNIKRTDAEVLAAINRLEAITRKRSFRKVTHFGDDNVSAIEAQIEVLQERLTEDDVMDREDREDFTEHQASSARDAANWLAGDDDSDPIKGWVGLH